MGRAEGELEERARTREARVQDFHARHRRFAGRVVVCLGIAVAFGGVAFGYSYAQAVAASPSVPVVIVWGGEMATSTHPWDSVLAFLPLSLGLVFFGIGTTRNRLVGPGAGDRETGAAAGLFGGMALWAARWTAGSGPASIQGRATVVVLAVLGVALIVGGATYVAGDQVEPLRRLRGWVDALW